MALNQPRFLRFAAARREGRWRWGVPRLPAVARGCSRLAAVEGSSKFQGPNAKIGDKGNDEGEERSWTDGDQELSGVGERSANFAN